MTAILFLPLALGCTAPTSDDAEVDESASAARVLAFGDADLAGDLQWNETRTWQIETGAFEQRAVYRLRAPAGRKIVAWVRPQFSTSTATGYAYLVGADRNVRASWHFYTLGVYTLEYEPKAEETVFLYVRATSARKGDLAHVTLADVPFPDQSVGDGPAQSVAVDTSATATLPLRAIPFGPCRQPGTPPREITLPIHLEGTWPGALQATSGHGYFDGGSKPKRIAPDGTFVITGGGVGRARLLLGPNGELTSPIRAEITAFGGIHNTCTAFNRSGGYEHRLEHPVTVVFP